MPRGQPGRVPTRSSRPNWPFACGVAICAWQSIAAAAYLPIHGGPTYDAATGTGFTDPFVPYNPGSTAGNGTGVGFSTKVSHGVSLGSRAFRWTAWDAGATELGTLGADIAGVSSGTANAINAIGTAVGSAVRYDGGRSLGQRAVRWDPSSTVATELATLGAAVGGSSYASAFAVNAEGTSVGVATRYSVAGSDMGQRPVCWAANGTAATELGVLGTDAHGVATGTAYAINSSGTAIGFARKYAGGVELGDRPVRWAAGGSAATELGVLGTTAAGLSTGQAYAVNDAGTAVGFAVKYVDGVDLGNRAVRWDAASTTAAELDELGTTSAGAADSFAYAVNAAGTTVGYATKYRDGQSLGSRAVRWDAGGTSIAQLGLLGIDARGYAAGAAYAVDASGIAVGYAEKYVAGQLVGSRAVMWDAAGIVVDLNTLVDPAAGWTLTEARGIGADGWITGIGQFDPDGEGPMSPYGRAFLIQVPEPATVALLQIACVGLLRRRRCPPARVR